MRCKECGLRVRGKKHAEGYHHKTVRRVFGILQKDDKGKLIPRTAGKTVAKVEDEQ